MTYSINWPITVRSAVPFRSGNYYAPNGRALVVFPGAFLPAFVAHHLQV